MLSLPWRPDQPKTPWPSPSPSTPHVSLTTHWLIYLFDLFLFFKLDFRLFIYYFWFWLLHVGLKVGATCSKWGLLSSCSARASHGGTFSCCEAWALQHAGLSRCDTWALLPRSTWELPGPGVEPLSLALSSGLCTTGPPRKSHLFALGRDTAE